MPNWSREQYESFMSRAGNKRAGAGASDEEFKDVDAGQDHNKTKLSGVAKAMHPQFKVSITLRYSDNRRRDIDGAATSLLDSLVKAVR